MNFTYQQPPSDTHPRFSSHIFFDCFFVHSFDFFHCVQELIFSHIGQILLQLPIFQSIVFDPAICILVFSDSMNLILLPLTVPDIAVGRRQLYSTIHLAMFKIALVEIAITVYECPLPMRFPTEAFTLINAIVLVEDLPLNFCEVRLGFLSHRQLLVVHIDGLAKYVLLFKSRKLLFWLSLNLLRMARIRILLPGLLW